MNTLTRKEFIRNFVCIVGMSTFGVSLYSNASDPVTKHLSDLAEAMKANNPNLTDTQIAEFLHPEHVVHQSFLGRDYSFEFKNSLGQIIRLESHQGKIKTIIS